MNSRKLNFDCAVNLAHQTARGKRETNRQERQERNETRGAGESIKPGVSGAKPQGQRIPTTTERAKRATERSLGNLSCRPLRGLFPRISIVLGFRSAPPQALCYRPLSRAETDIHGYKYSCGAIEIFTRAPSQLAGVLLAEYPFLVGQNSLLISDHRIKFFLIGQDRLLIRHYCFLVPERRIQFRLVGFNLFLIFKDGLLVRDDGLLISKYFVVRHSVLLYPNWGVIFARSASIERTEPRGMASSPSCFKHPLQETLEVIVPSPAFRGVIL
jgi:hypothetical protein